MIRYNTMNKEEYEKLPGIRQSRLAKLINNPKTFVQPDEDPSEAMELGDLVHCLVLEPDQFNSRYIMEPKTLLGEEVNKKKPLHRELLAKMEMDALTQGQKVLDEKTYARAKCMKDAVWSIPLVRQLIENSKVEVGGNLRYDDELVVKGKADVITMGGNLVDLKTTGDASPEAFRKTIYYYNYDFQMYVYKKIFGTNGSIIIAVENKKPYTVGIYNVDAFLAIGEKKFINAVNEYKRLSDFNFSGPELEYTRGDIKALSPLEYMGT